MAKAEGSPPHMRGKAAWYHHHIFSVGITPAYAGKSQSSQSQSVQNGDHPRICGEKRVDTLLKIAKAGSPPHMRGKERVFKEYRLSVRITPAYAGKSQRVRHRVGLYRDHPRICGEKTKKIP